jgi:hypothetical protein
MRLDHVSYVASHDQISDVVNRIGSQIGTAFVDGGMHPKFGTRNFTAPLLNGQYIEVVCPMEHPSTDLTPFGRAVKKKAEEGGGWLTWVFSTEDINNIESKFKRSSVLGIRARPDGTELQWKQIGVKDIANSNEFPFFIQWLTKNHPSLDGKAVAKIKKIVISSKNQLDNSLFNSEIKSAISNLEIEWVNPVNTNQETGITEIHFKTNGSDIIIN